MGKLVGNETLVGCVGNGANGKLAPLFKTTDSQMEDEEDMTEEDAFAELAFGLVALTNLARWDSFTSARFRNASPLSEKNRTTPEVRYWTKIFIEAK